MFIEECRAYGFLLAWQLRVALAPLYELPPAAAWSSSLPRPAHRPDRLRDCLYRRL